MELQALYVLHERMLRQATGALPEAAVDDLIGQIRDLDMDDVRAKIAEHEAGDGHAGHDH